MTDHSNGVNNKVSFRTLDISVVSDDGFAQTGPLDGFLLLFTARKKTDPDFHSEINAIVFTKFFTDKVYPKPCYIGTRHVLI